MHPHTNSETQTHTLTHGISIANSWLKLCPLVYFRTSWEERKIEMLGAPGWTGYKEDKIKISKVTEGER